MRGRGILNSKSGRAATVGPARQPSWPRLVAWARWSLLALTIAAPVWMATTRPPTLAGAAAEPVSAIAPHLRMTAPALVGRLRDGRAYRVEADAASLPGPGDRIVLLDGVRGAVQMKGGGQADLSAGRGRYDRAAERLNLEDGIVAVTTSGYRLETTRAELWRAPEGFAARSDRPTRLSGPAGTAEAGGFEAAPGLHPVRLTGPASIRANGSAVN